MTALYIILGIILFFYIIFHISFSAEFILSNDKKEVKVKYLFFTIYPLKKNKKKNKKLKKKVKKKSKHSKVKKTKNEPESKSNVNVIKSVDKEKTEPPKISEVLSSKDEPNEKIPENKSGTDDVESKIDGIKAKIDSFKPYVNLAKKSIKKLLKAIRFYDIEIDLAVANEDAYKAAINYGKANTAVYSFLALLKIIFTFKINYVNLQCKFNSNESDYLLKGKIKTRLSTLIALAVSILANFLYTNYKIKRQKNKLNKETEIE